MKAKDLADKLMEHPEFDVTAVYSDYDDSKSGYAALTYVKFKVEVGDIGHSDKVIILDLSEESNIANPPAKREFLIDTPCGKLKVYAKHDTDSEEDFPGVFIDLVHPDGDIVLTCVEYDSVAKNLYTRVYGDGLDDSPTDSVCHENLPSSIAE